MFVVNKEQEVERVETEKNQNGGNADIVDHILGSTLECKFENRR